MTVQETLLTMATWEVILGWDTTSMGVPWGPVDERIGVTLSISLEEPISAQVCPCTIPMETQWETREWVGGLLSRFSIQPFSLEHTPLHYTQHWLHIALDQSENRLGHQKDPAKNISITPHWRISLLLRFLGETAYSIKCELHFLFSRCLSK